MTQQGSTREGYVAAGYVLAGYLAWAVPAVVAGANTLWVAALLTYSLVAAAAVIVLAPRASAIFAFVDRHAGALVVVGIALFAAALIALNVWQTLTFSPGMYAEDTAYYGQILWNSLHGELLSGNVLQGRLYDPPVESDFALHVSPVLALLLPVYAVFSDPLALLLVRDVVLAAAAWPLFLLARDRLGAVGGVAAAYLYLLNPVVLAQGTAAFYLLAFAPLPFFYALHAFIERRFAAFFWAMAVAFTLREDLALTFGAFGVIALIRRYPLKWIAFGAGVPAAWWLVTTLVIQPSFGRTGNSSFDVALAGGQWDPLAIYRQLLDPAWLLAAADGAATYLWQVIGWAGYSGALGLEALLAIPAVVMHLYLGRISFDGLDVYSRFAVVPSVVVIASTVLFVGRWLAGEASRRPLVCMAAVLLLPVVSIIDGNKDLLQRTVAVTAIRNDAAALREGLAQIPAEATVAAPYYALPHLANRANLYFLEFLDDYHDARPEYVLLDQNFERPWLDAAASPQYAALLKDYLGRPDYETLWERSGYVLLHLNRP